MGNLGACVRVAAAADAAALLTIGENDPWHPDAVRGAAGLHYALPAVAAVERAPHGEGRPLLALDPEGEEIDPATIDPARRSRLRHRAPRAQRRAARRRRREGGAADARRRLQPQPRDLGGGGALRVVGCSVRPT